MKHLKLFFALFAMLALGVGNAWGAELGDGYEKVTNISSLTTGDRVVVYADAISKGVTGWNGTKDATVAESGWVEYLVEVASGGVYLKDETANSYIASPGSSNQFKYGTKAVCSVNAKGVLACNSRYLYNNGSYYRMYGDKSSDNAYKPFYVYKVVAGGAETEDLGDALKWSAASATVQMGADDNEYPTLTNDKNVAVTYSSSTPATATIDATGVVTLVKEGTTTISAFYEGSEIEGVTYAAKTVSYELTVKPAPLVIEPIVGGIVDILTHDCLAATSSSYTNFSGKQAKNDNHSDAVYAGRSSRNGNSTQYSIQLNTIGTGRIATTTTGGLAKRVYVKWATQGTLNTNNRSLYIYGSNDAFTGSETSTSATKIGTITFTTGAAEAYVDLTGDYKYILITGSGAIYMDEIHVTWVSAAGTVVTPTIHGDAEFVESTEVSITAEDGYKVYYTTDGTEPTNANTEYTAPFSVTATTTVKAIAYDGAAKSEVVSKTLKALEILTCEAAAEKCAATESTDKYVVRGYVTSIPYPYSATNTTPTFWMADTKDGGNVMQAYKVTPLEEADKAVIVGDQVQVIGKIKLYNETPEFNGGTYTITVPNPKYNVNITSAHGTVTATPASAVEGAEVTLTLEVLESGWVFQSWTVTDASSKPIEVVDNKFTMPASDVTVVANYTESEAPDAVLTLMANGQQHSQVTYKQGEKAELPETIANDCVKIFVGWSADANCAVAPEYAPGAEFELTAAEHTLYAVYASGTTGETVTIKHNSSSTVNMTGENDANTYFNLDANNWTIVSDKGAGSNHIGLNKDGGIRLYYNEDGSTTLTITAPSKVASIQLACANNYGDALVKVDGNAVTPVDGVYAIDAETFVITNNSSTQVRINSITVTLAGELANFSTTCTGALAAPTFSVEAGEYTEAQSITLSAAEGTIYYTLDGTTPTSESTKYTEAIVLDACGETTIKAIAIGSESESPVASATYTLNLPIPANDAENPYTGAQAIEVYNGGCYDGTTLVYVTGTVQEATYSDQYGNYTIVFADGYQCFRLQETATEKFTEDKIKAGDVIVACGKLDKYGSNYQLAAGCYLVKHTPSAKADVELAWNPETVTLTVGDAFTAPTLVNTQSVAVTFESSNDAVATVDANGVIALVDAAVGTATITATFAGDNTYNPASATCTIKVNPVAEDCEGSDDFVTATAENPTSYNSRTTDAGWSATHAAKTTIEGYTYLIINGKTSTVGTITSPTLNGGIGSIKIRYANTYSEANGVSFRLDIKQNDEVVKTYTITKAKADVTQNTVYTELIENINVAGDFVMVITNLSPSNSTSNKDRVSIGRLCWTGYEIPTYTITATANPAEGGSVSGAGTYKENTNVTLTATPNDSYTFVNWTKEGVEVSADATYIFTATEDITLVANFEQTAPITPALEIIEDNAVCTIGRDGSLTMEGQDLYVEVGEFDAENILSEYAVYCIILSTWDGGSCDAAAATLNGSKLTLTGTFVTEESGDTYNFTISGELPSGEVESVVLDLAVTDLIVEYDEEVEGWVLFGTSGEYTFTLVLDEEPTTEKEYTLNAEYSQVRYSRYRGFVSGSLTKEYDDTYGDMYVGQLNTTLGDIPYVINLTMCNYSADPSESIELIAEATYTVEDDMLSIEADWEGTPVQGILVGFENVSGQEFDEVWLSVGEGEDEFFISGSAIVTIEDGELAIEGVFSFADEKYYNVYIWGTAPATEPIIPTITLGDGDNSAVIAENEDQTVNVIVDRSFEEGDEWYTLCVPFNMPASVIGKAYQISGLVQQTPAFVEVYLAEKTTIVAGEPYLIKPTVTVDEFVVENVTIVNTQGTSISKSISGLSVTMQGVINGNGTTDGLYWVGNGGLLYNDTASKSGLRAYFNIMTSSGIAPRMRVVAGENVETGIEDIITTDTPVKVIENDQLIIIRGCEKYNVQGQRL